MEPAQSSASGAPTGTDVLEHATWFLYSKGGRRTEGGRILLRESYWRQEPVFGQWEARSGGLAAEEALARMASLGIARVLVPDCLLLSYVRCSATMPPRFSFCFCFLKTSTCSMSTFSLS